MPFQQNSLNSSRKPVEETILPSVKYWVEVVFKESFLKKIELGFLTEEAYSHGGLQTRKLGQAKQNRIGIDLTIILHPGFQPNVRGAL